MVYRAGMNGMYNNMMPGGMSIMQYLPDSGGGGGLPTTTAAPAAQSGMTNPGGAVGVASPNPNGGFIPAAEGQVAGYNPATGQSGFVDEAQQDAYGRFTTSPDYLFRFNEGQRMLDSSAAARGTLMSGKQLRALTELGQNLASGEYGNYMNRLYGVAGLAPTGGQNVAAMGGQSFNNMFNAQSQFGTNVGNAIGAAGQNTANIWGSALGNIDFGGMASGLNNWWQNRGGGPTIEQKQSGMF